MNTKSLIKKTLKLKINRQVKPIKSIHSVLIMWDSKQSKTDVEELKTFGHELRNSGKDVVFLCFYDLKKLSPEMQSTELYQLCSKADFNFWGQPSSENLKKITTKTFDLLINASLNSNNFLNTIAVYSKSLFRVGCYSDSEDIAFYEISIKPNGADLMENFLIEIGKCLNKIQ